MGRHLWLLAALLLPLLMPARERIDLNGAWQFRVDPNAVGEREEWHSPGVPFDRSIRVPGAWQAQGVGEPAGILKSHYSGPAWYRRSIAVPASWKGQAVHLRVGGALRRTAVYLNGRKLGEHDGFSTPFSFDVTSAVRPGEDNVIALRVVNPGARIDDAPHAQAGNEPTGMMNYIGNWGGIYGDVILEATSPVSISEVAIRPQVAGGSVTLNVSVGALGTTVPLNARVEVAIDGGRETAAVQNGGARLSLAIPGARLWTPDTPHLYTATVRLLDGTRELDRVEERFGMREFSTQGRTLLLNGKPLYLRGYGDDNVEVLTGVPPSSREVYLERLRRARSFGFNAVRFHSMTPTREFFEAADETGLLVMAELPAAYTMYFLPHKDFLRAELERILRTHRNHPSFLSLAFGNEFNLNWLKTDAEKKEFQFTVDEFYRYAKSIDPDRLILSNDGLVLRPSDMFSLYTGAPADAPTVRHEFGSYYCSLPDIALIPRFTGVMSPTWLQQKKTWVEKSGLNDVYPTYVRNSQRLQQLGRKYQIERVRQDPNVTGYHYWLILDYPGGTGEGDSWEEGWFDYFWQPKNIEPRDGQEINSPVLLLIDAGVDERTFWNDAGKSIGVQVSNYGEQALKGSSIDWVLTGGERQLHSGTIRDVSVPMGQIGRAGDINIPPVPGDVAQKLELTLTLQSGSATYLNRWNFWSFPRLKDTGAAAAVHNVRWDGIRRLFPSVIETRRAPAPGKLYITSKLDREAAEFLRSGGSVWLLADRSQHSRFGDATFFPASGGALGTFAADHPAWGGFPQEGYFDLQFYNLLEGGWSFPVDNWPQELEPIAGGIRTTSSFLSKMKNLSKTGYIVEAKVGAGKLLITTLRLRENLDEAYPEAVYLFDRLLRYAASPAFAPQVALTDDQIERLMN